MAKASASEKKKGKAWKIAVLAIAIAILTYLILMTTNDPRWVFTGIDSTLIVGVLAGIAVIIYLLKIRGPNRKA
mgnify:CR=1 FL=1